MITATALRRLLAPLIPVLLALVWASTAWASTAAAQTVPAPSNPSGFVRVGHLAPDVGPTPQWPRRPAPPRPPPNSSAGRNRSPARRW